MRALVLLLPAVLLLLLSGCGIKGPLYLPTPPAHPAAPEAAGDHSNTAESRNDG
ncbi:MAG: lipoprotein [Rhodocyclaceae bacterium]|jgi:predicted small lipoprotein YifL|nr:lipoprotein [Rhodocyclaceae bacterium]